MEHCTCVLLNPIDLITFIISRPENDRGAGRDGVR